MPPARPASETDHPVTSPETMRSAATQLAIPDLQPRFDGAVVRIDIPADRMFEAGTANLLPAGTATLTKVAEEIDRVWLLIAALTTPATAASPEVMSATTTASLTALRPAVAWRARRRPPALRRK